jgi:hypothetical protein
MKDKGLTTQGIPIVQVDNHILQWIQEHRLEKWVSRDFKRHDKMYIDSLCRKAGAMPNHGYGEYNHGYLKSNPFPCPRSKYPHKYKPYPSKFKSHPTPQKSIKIPYLRRRFFPRTSSTCFICTQSGHWDTNFPKKKKRPQLATLFSHVIEPEWWDICEYELGQPLDGHAHFLQPECLDSNIPYSFSSEESYSSKSEQFASESSPLPCSYPYSFQMLSRSCSSPTQRLTETEK